MRLFIKALMKRLQTTSSKTKPSRFISTLTNSSANIHHYSTGTKTEIWSKIGIKEVNQENE